MAHHSTHQSLVGQDSRLFLPSSRRVLLNGKSIVVGFPMDSSVYGLEPVRLSESSIIDHHEDDDNDGHLQ